MIGVNTATGPDGTTRDVRAPLLRTLLDAFLPRDASEQSHLTRMRELLDATLDPFARSQFVPGHFTASAFVCAPVAGSALLIAHPTLGRWLQPGGHIEPTDASPLDAARREVAEETGLIEVGFEDALFDLDIHAIPARAAMPAHLHFDLRFLGIVEAASDACGADGIDTRWVPLAGIQEVGADASVMRMARKAAALFTAG
jgi:8-oxo-dGTP pyrophosphatase MutT (NUDIX family)